MAYDDMPEEDALILDAINKWLDRDVRPHVLRLDHADEYPAEMVAQMQELGLFGATIPVEYGGLGLSPRPMRGSWRRSRRCGCR